MVVRFWRVAVMDASVRVLFYDLLVACEERAGLAKFVLVAHRSLFLQAYLKNKIKIVKLGRVKAPI